MLVSESHGVSLMSVFTVHCVASWREVWLSYGVAVKAFRKPLKGECMLCYFLRALSFPIRAHGPSKEVTKAQGYFRLPFEQH